MSSSLRQRRVVRLHKCETQSTVRPDRIRAPVHDGPAKYVSQYLVNMAASEACVSKRCSKQNRNPLISGRAKMILAKAVRRHIDLNAYRPVRCLRKVKTLEHLHEQLCTALAIETYSVSVQLARRHRIRSEAPMRTANHIAHPVLLTQKRPHASQT